MVDEDVEAAAQKVREDAALLADVEQLGTELQSHMTAVKDVRVSLYPKLYQANKIRKISLARLQVLTGLTRGRIHQIVNLASVREQADAAAAEAPAPKGWG